MTQYKNIYTVVFILFIGFLACKKDDAVLEEPGKYNRALNIDAPIFELALSANDLLEVVGDIDGLRIDDQGLLHAGIRDSFDFDWINIIEFTPMRLDMSMDLRAKQAFSSNDTIVAINNTEQEVDRVLVKSARMEIEVSSPSGYTGDYTLSFPEITMANGSVLSFTHTMDGTTHNDSRDLADATIDFIQNADDYSSFTLITNINAEPNGGGGSADIDISVQLVNLVSQEMFGYFGQKDLLRTGEMAFVLSDGFGFSNHIEFKDLTFSIETSNSVGVPLSIEIDSVEFRKRIGDNHVLLEVQGTNAIEMIPAEYGHPPIPGLGNLTLNNTNSNLVDGINHWPDDIFYRATARVNPDGDSGQENFHINDSTGKIKVIMGVDVPFWFKASDFKRSDVINFNIKDMIGDESTLDYLEEVNLYFDFNNGFPFDITAQTYAINDQLLDVDSLFSSQQKLWASPVIDENGRAGAPALSMVDISLNNEQIRNMYNNNVKFLQIRSKVNSGGEAGSPDTPTFVKLFDDYTLEMKLSVSIVSGTINKK